MRSQCIVSFFAASLLVCIDSISIAAAAEWPKGATSDQSWPQSKDWPRSSQPKDHSNSSSSESKILPIRPEIQLSPVWCWAAVSAMVFEYYNVPNASPVNIWQCGIVGVVALMSGNLNCNADCRLCQVPAGSAQNIKGVLEGYPRRMNSSTYLSAEILSDHLTWGEVRNNIDAKRPIIVGINPGSPGQHFGSSQHVALIIGYRDEGKTLIVNDPYPYWLQGPHPYEEVDATMLRQGRWSIKFDSFVTGLDWKETILVERE
jgi:Papain-like cysteine protease AvrRpt2